MITLWHSNVKDTFPPSTEFDVSYIIPKLQSGPLFLRYNYKLHSWCRPEGDTIQQLQLAEQM